MVLPQFVWTVLLAVGPWSPAKWRIDLDIGRENKFRDDDDPWGRSGARLVLPTTLLLETDDVVDDMTGEKYNQLTVLQNPTYVTSDGELEVQMGSSGGWKLATRRMGTAGCAGQLYLWLDLLASATRQDVSIEAPQRLYLTANCWREDELNIGLDRFQPLKKAYENAQIELENRLSHDTGDRRLDGADLIDTALGSVDMAVLVKERDDRRAAMIEAERTFPNPDKLSQKGRWPGSTELLSIARGVVVGRKEEKGWLPVLTRTSEVVLGRWTARSIEDEDDLEIDDYLDEEEDNVGNG